MKDNSNYFTIDQILQVPCVIDKTHESCFRSYHALKFILKMVHRGDSKETIAAVAEHLMGEGAVYEKTSRIKET